MSFEGKTPQEAATDSTRMIGCMLMGLIVFMLGSCLWLVTGCFSRVGATEQQAYSLVAKQHRNDACVLAAVATSMNYKSGGLNYTSAGLALAYKLKYHAEDWAKDGDTSHQAQQLAEDAGFQVEYGTLDYWGKVAALKYLAWAKQYPVVFLAGVPNNHAVTVLALMNNDDLLIADPWTGETYRENADSVYGKLELEKWYFALKKW